MSVTYQLSQRAGFPRPYDTYVVMFFQIDIKINFKPLIAVQPTLAFASCYTQKLLAFSPYFLTV
jgi:hypothetical protein